MRIVSWNVNGLRSVIKKNAIQDMIASHSPDIICLQESKLSEGVYPQLDGYDCIHNVSKSRKGYAGTSVYVKSIIMPMIKSYSALDNEGRVTVIELEHMYILTVYVPNSGRKTARGDSLHYRTNVWDPWFYGLCKSIDSHKPLIVCGDLNVARHTLDVAKPNETVPGYRPEERHSFERHLGSYFIDQFRHEYPDGVQYTWWSAMGNAKSRNIGMRLDYFLLSPKIRHRRNIYTCQNQDGSDHCPIILDIHD